MTRRAVAAVVLATFLAALLAAGAAFVWLDGLGGPGDRALKAGAPGAHPLRIVALGTSLTARAGWPDALEKRLKACDPAGATVVQHARPNAGSDWGLGEVGAVAALAPDLVIIEFAMNDADLKDGLWPWQSRATHLALIARLRAARPDAAVLLLATNPVQGVKRITRFLLPLYQRQYGAVADAAGVGLVDGYSRWQARPDWAGAIPDGVHPDPGIETQVLAGPIFEAVRDGFALTCG